MRAREVRSLPGRPPAPNKPPTVNPRPFVNGFAVLRDPSGEQEILFVWRGNLPSLQLPMSFDGNIDEAVEQRIEELLLRALLCSRQFSRHEVVERHIQVGRPLPLCNSIHRRSVLTLADLYGERTRATRTSDPGLPRIKALIARAEHHLEACMDCRLTLMGRRYARCFYAPPISALLTEQMLEEICTI